MLTPPATAPRHIEQPLGPDMPRFENPSLGTCSLGLVAGRCSGGPGIVCVEPKHPCTVQTDLDDILLSAKDSPIPIIEKEDDMSSAVHNFALLRQGMRLCDGSCHYAGCEQRRDYFIL